MNSTSIEEELRGIKVLISVQFQCLNIDCLCEVERLFVNSILFVQDFPEIELEVTVRVGEDPEQGEEGEIRVEVREEVREEVRVGVGVGGAGVGGAVAVVAKDR